MPAPKKSLRDKFLSKTATTKKVNIVVDGEQLEMTVKALSEPHFRKIRADHPARPEDRTDGIPYNGATFPPALLSEAVVDPQLSYEEWTTIFTNGEWSLGELREIFDEAVSATTSGFDLPFGGKG